MYQVCMVLVHGLSETLGEGMAMRLAHVLHIFQVVSVPVSVPTFPCFPVDHDPALRLVYRCLNIYCVHRSVTYSIY